MCEIRELASCRKRIYISLPDGYQVRSEWFYDDSDRAENASNATVRELHELAQLKYLYGISENEYSEWSVNYEKSTDCVYISEHAFARMKQRNGWNRRTALRMVAKVHDSGTPFSDRPDVRSKIHEPGERILKYGDDIYIFCNNILVTVYRISASRRNVKRKIG